MTNCCCKKPTAEQAKIIEEMLAAPYPVTVSSQGYYNILAKSATIGGHMKYDSFSAVAFTTFPFMGRESLAVQFFTKEGKTAFSVFVGRENHQLVESVKEKFIAARAKFSA